mgnify:FL=1
MDFPTISIPFFIAGGISLVFAYYADRHTSTPGARSFAVFMLSMAIYCLGYGMELSSPDLATALFWNNIQYIGILSFPNLYLIFVLQYTGRGRILTSRTLGLLFLPVIFFYIAKLLDGQLQWVYAAPHMELVNGNLVLAFEWGPLSLPISI